jgi:hypothetical protein
MAQSLWAVRIALRMRRVRPTSRAPRINLLNGTNPFPAAFDRPKTMEEILEAAGGFVVSC